MQYSTLIAHCRRLPHAQCERKWGNTLTFLVGRKMFALFILDAKDRPVDLWCKVDDDLFLSYTGLPGIRPAPYLARAKWIALEKHAMTDAMAKKLLARARDIVFAKLTRRLQRELESGASPTTSS